MIMITNGAFDASVTEAKQDNAIKAMAAEIILKDDAEAVRNMDQHSFTLAARDKAAEMGYVGTHVGTVPTAILDLVNEHDVANVEEEKALCGDEYINAIACQHAITVPDYDATVNTSDAVAIKTLLDALGEVGVNGNAVAIVRAFRDRVNDYQASM